MILTFVVTLAIHLLWRHILPVVDRCGGKYDPNQGVMLTVDDSITLVDVQELTEAFDTLVFLSFDLDYMWDNYQDYKTTVMFEPVYTWEVFNKHALKFELLCQRAKQKR